MRNNNKNQKRNLRPLWVVVILAATAAIAAMMLLSQGIIQPPAPTQTQPPETTMAPVQTTDAMTQPPVTEGTAIDLGQDLRITDLGNYSGIYMEDGTNDPVMDVMMLVLHNTGEQDLQYLELELNYDGQIYAFKASNLAADSAVVLLEQNRQAYPGGQPQQTIVRHAAFFSEAMDLCTDALQISGMEGALNVKNISDRDISGDIYVYYKYSSEDLFYGGITFRAKVPGLRAGELYQVPTGHYAPDSCTIVQVTMVG